MAWSICYSAAAEMKLNNQRNAYSQAKESVLPIVIKYPMDMLRSQVIDDQQKWDATLPLYKSDYLKYNILNAQI